MAQSSPCDQAEAALQLRSQAWWTSPASSCSPIINPVQGNPSLKLCIQGTWPHTVTRVAKTCGSISMYFLYICAQHKDKIRTCREGETRVPACSTSHPQPLGTARSQCQQPSSSCTPDSVKGHKCSRDQRGRLWPGKSLMPTALWVLWIQASSREKNRTEKADCGHSKGLDSDQSAPECSQEMLLGRWQILLVQTLCPQTYLASKNVKSNRTRGGNKTPKAAHSISALTAPYFLMTVVML